MTAPSTFPYTVTTVTHLGQRMTTNIPTRESLVAFLVRNAGNPLVCRTNVKVNEIPACAAQGVK